MFLDGQPTAEQFDALASDKWIKPNERLALGDRALYIDYGDGVADSTASISQDDASPGETPPLPSPLRSAPALAGADLVI